MTAPFTPQGTIMIARRDLLLALCFGAVFTAGGVPAAEPSATAFVEAIYAPYKGKVAKGVALDTDAAVSVISSPGLRR